MPTLRALHRHLVGAAVGAMIVTGCGPSPPQPPPVQSQPCCRILLAYSRGTTREAVRIGPEPQGTWSSIRDILGPAFPLPTSPQPPLISLTIDVAHAAVIGSPLYAAARQAHELYASNSGSLLYRHQDGNGQFGGLVTLPQMVSVPGNGPLGSSSQKSASFYRVSATPAGQDLDVCVVGSPTDVAGDETKWSLYHARRMGLPPEQPEVDRWAAGGNTGNIWDDIGLSGAGQAGHRGFRDVGCASVTDPATGAEQLNVCAVTMDGRLVWSARAADGSYSSFIDVGKQLGVGNGSFARVSCVGRDNILYLAATWGQKSGSDAFTEDEPTAKLTFHTPNGWLPFVDVRTAASTPLSDLKPIRDVAIGFCNAGVTDDPRQLQLNIVLLRANNEVTTTVFTQGPQEWSPLQPASQWMPRETLNERLRPEPVSPLSIYATNIYKGISVAEQPFLP